MKSKGKIATTIVIALLCTALVATAGFALAEREGGKQSARVGAAYGGAALGEFSMALAEMDETLSQAVYATDGALLAGLCSRAAANAASALTAMSSLPADTQELERMAGYINSAGDFLLYLARSASRGALPDDALRGGLAEIAGGIAVLAEGAERILTEHMDGALEMDEYAASPAEAEGESVGTELAALEEELPEFPALDYDGAYSVSAQGREAKYLEGKGEVSEATARAAAAEFLGLPQTRLASAGLADSAVPCYVFSVDDAGGDGRSIAVSQRGGVVLALSCAREPQGASLSLDEAAERAAAFLERRGWADMEPVSSVRGGDIGVITFAAVQDGVLCLPDAVSVGVALDNGEICSFNAADYVMNHTRRALPEPGVDAEAAAECLPAGLSAEGARLVLLETEGAREVLAWELDCRNAAGEPVAVYADAADGRQIKIEAPRS